MRKCVKIFAGETWVIDISLYNETKNKIKFIKKRGDDITLNGTILITLIYVNVFITIGVNNIICFRLKNIISKYI